MNFIYWETFNKLTFYSFANSKSKMLNNLFMLLFKRSFASYYIYDVNNFFRNFDIINYQRYFKYIVFLIEYNKDQKLF